jgi:intracellular sulfur oxidation DsrE/DsrF family protein
LVVLALLVMGAPDVAARKKAEHRIVVQLSGKDTMEWKAAINNLKNLKQGWGDHVAIELVAHGPGVGFLLSANSAQQEAIRSLKKQGVVFVVCENSLREKKTSKAEVMREADFVPMGIGEIVLRQEDGWTYIKSGF